jgi:hypothetical protein
LDDEEEVGGNIDEVSEALEEEPGKALRPAFCPLVEVRPDI